MLFKTLFKIILPIFLVLLTYIALNSSNIPEEQRQNAYLVMAGFGVVLVISKLLSKLFKAFSFFLVTGGIVLLLYFLYTYNALPFIDKSVIDGARTAVGV